MAIDKFKKKLLIRVSIAAGIVAVFALFIILLNADINKRLVRIKEYKTELAIRTQTLAILAELQQEAKRAEPLMQELQSALPSRDELISLPRELEKIAKRNKVDFGFVFGQENPAQGNQAGTVRFTMTLAGTYQNLVLFLRELESSPYVVSIASIDVSRREKDTFAFATGGTIAIR